MQYEWRAVYSDGTFLDQVEVKTGLENKYTDIDRSRLVIFALFPVNEREPKVVLNLKSGQKLVYRRRSLLRMNPGSVIEDNSIIPAIRESVWILGFHENRQGVNVQMLAFVFEDGRVELLDRWRDDHTLYGPIVLLPEET
jgi:hypothetical protein